MGALYYKQLKQNETIRGSLPTTIDVFELNIETAEYEKRHKKVIFHQCQWKTTYKHSNGILYPTHHILQKLLLTAMTCFDQ